MVDWFHSDAVPRALRVAGAGILTLSSIFMASHIGSLDDGCEIASELNAPYIAASVLGSVFLSWEITSIVARQFRLVEKGSTGEMLLAGPWAHGFMEALFAAAILSFMLGLHNEWSEQHNTNTTEMAGALAKMEMTCADIKKITDETPELANVYPANICVPAANAVNSGGSPLSPLPAATLQKWNVTDKACFPVSEEHAMSEGLADFIKIGGAVGIGLSVYFAMSVEKFWSSGSKVSFSSDPLKVLAPHIVAFVAMAMCATSGILYFTSFGDDADWTHTNCSELSYHQERVAGESDHPQSGGYAIFRAHGGTVAHDAAKTTMDGAAISLLVAGVVLFGHTVLKYFMDAPQKSSSNRMAKQAVSVFLDVGTAVAASISFAQFVSVIGATTIYPFDGTCALRLAPQKNGTLTREEYEYSEFTGSSASTAVMFMSISYGMILLAGMLRTESSLQSSSYEG